MGRSGARTGFKVYSINTTIRNPKRNVDFLNVFKNYDGRIMDSINTNKLLFDLVQSGTYKFSNLPNSVKDKLEKGQELTDEEVLNAIEENPQATGSHGRVMTQLRALKDQGFLRFNLVSRGLFRINITKLGNDLVDNNIDGTITYTKAMIGLHAKNPARSSMLNESVPFLNTIFVINGVNKAWADLGNNPKGILRHEFGAFVLSMKDCNYQKAIDDILEYRSLYKYEINKDYIIEYLKKNNILDLKFKSIIRDYPDDVFRKFEMTGLIRKRGKFNYKYIDFSEYNIEKVNIIIENYQNYFFHDFKNEDEYYKYLENIVIPWETDDLIRKKVVEAKTKALGLVFDEKVDLASQETMLDQTFYRKALDKAISEISFDKLKQELMILSRTDNSKSNFEELAEPLRLEYLLALLLGKQYGTKNLVSNIIYGEDGRPLHYAPAGKSDIILYHEKGSYIFEPTMQRNRSQLLNYETTNIVRHYMKEKEKSGLDFKIMLVAPVIHCDVADYFKYQANSCHVNIIPATIEKCTQLFIDNKDIESLNAEFNIIINEFKNSDLTYFVDKMNNYRIE